MGNGVKQADEEKAALIRKTLRDIRIASGHSMKAMAEEFGYKTASGWQHNETEYKKPSLSPGMIAKIEMFVNKHGLDRNLLLRLRANPGHVGGDHGASAEVVQFPGLKQTMSIKETDIRQIDGNGDIATEGRTISEWKLPTDLVTVVTNAPEERMRIITVVGDMMAPTFTTGQKLIIDLNDRRPTPSGIFLVWDGLGDSIWNVAYIPHSDPPRVRIFPDNAKYDAYERELSQAHIKGRVLGRWAWV